jgi:hypothetical protein
MVFWVWFGLRRPVWLPWLVAGLTALLATVYMLGDEVFPGLVSHEVAKQIVTAATWLEVIFFALLLWVVIKGIRTRGVEGWLVLPMALLRGIIALRPILEYFHLPYEWFVFGVMFNIGALSNLLTVLIFAVLLLRRLVQSVSKQRLIAMDVKQAAEVQQVILPEARMVLPGILIESEYRPAREVGGDFFQIIPHKSDGSLLIVAGDVTGKGLQAGMLVALLVGAIRTAAAFNDDPVVVLNELNQRMMGRDGAQATCLALRIEADGAATLANAGHIAPYLNGEELPMEGALPLGMFEGAEASVMHFQLREGDRLTLMSDGISEATDADGKLFGFERVDELMRTATTAAEVAGAAQAFGQEDDISVISVTRTSVGVLAAN